MSIISHGRRGRQVWLVNRKDSGFTLIEVVVASAFFIASVATMFSINLSAKKMSVANRNYERAASVLNDMDELLQVVTHARVSEFINNGKGQWFTQEGLPVPAKAADKFYWVTGVLVPGANGRQQLALTVRWTDQGVQPQRSITANALVAVQ